MRLNPFILSSAAAITLSLVSAATYFYQSRKKEINDVMVFCKLQFNAWSCFDKLISYFEAAKMSINVCMPSIHNPAIQGRLLKLLKQKNIKIRIIIDRNGYTDSTGFLMKELIDAGAEIKCRLNEPYNMQHKFCLIDDKVLMTGTLNWGNDRSCDNWNYVYVTNKTQLVEPVKKEFHNMWAVDVDLEEALKERVDESKHNAEDSNESSTAGTSNEGDNDTVEIPRNVQTLADNCMQAKNILEIPAIIETPATPEVCVV